MPQGFRLGDPVLVAEVTGLPWIEFAQMLDEGDSRTLAGLVAVAVWQKHPDWRREKVVRYVESISISDLEVDSPSDARPPEPEADTTGRSAATSTGSSDSPDRSEAVSLASSGALS